MEEYTMYAFSVDRTWSALRSTALFHAVAQSMGCIHTPYSMAKYWQRVRPWQDSSSRWKRMRDGVAPLATTKIQLFEHFPHLRSLFEHPLWAIMGHLKTAHDWDELAETIRVGDKPLDGYGGKCTRLLFDRADWPCLPVHVVLMNTHASRFAFHRLWLKKNFMALLGLSSLQRPIIYIRAELVTVLRPLVLIQESVLRPSQESCTKNWGADEALLQLLRERSWLRGDDRHLALLIWNFRHEVQRELDVGSQQVSGRPGCGLPLPLRKKWYRKQAQWKDNPIYLNGVSCELPHQDDWSTVPSVRLSYP